MSTFNLKIIACDRVFYDGECKMIIFAAYDGEMAVMAHHEQMTASVEIGEIKYKLVDDTWHSAVVSDGLITVDNNTVTLLVYSCEKPEEIDEFRARAAMERAQEQLSAKQSIMEYHVSRASLSRAMARLKEAGKYTAK